MRPVALGFELLGEVFHLVSEHALLGEVVPFVGVGRKGTASSGIRASSGVWQSLSQLQRLQAATILPFVVPPREMARRDRALIAAAELPPDTSNGDHPAEQGAIAQWRGEVTHHPAFQRNNGLQMISERIPVMRCIPEHWGEDARCRIKHRHGRRR